MSIESDQVEYLTARLIAAGMHAVCDVLRIQGELWLVPEWLEYPEDGLQTPALAIRLNGLEFEEGIGGADFLVNASILAEVWAGEADHDQWTQYELLHGPSERFGFLPMRKLNA